MSRCKERVRDAGGWRLHSCDRPTKGEHNGKHLCGVHLAAARKREANEKKWNEERQERTERRNEAAQQCAALAAYGITATPQSDGSVVIADPIALLAALERER